MVFHLFGPFWYRQQPKVADDIDFILDLNFYHFKVVNQTSFNNSFPFEWSPQGSQFMIHHNSYLCCKSLLCVSPIWVKCASSFKSFTPGSVEKLSSLFQERSLCRGQTLGVSPTKIEVLPSWWRPAMGKQPGLPGNKLSIFSILHMSSFEHFFQGSLYQFERIWYSSSQRTLVLPDSPGEPPCPVETNKKRSSFPGSFQQPSLRRLHPRLNHRHLHLQIFKVLYASSQSLAQQCLANTGSS